MAARSLSSVTTARAASRRGGPSAVAHGVEGVGGRRPAGRHPRETPAPAPRRPRGPCAPAGRRGGCARRRTGRARGTPRGRRCRRRRSRGRRRRRPGARRRCGPGPRGPRRRGAPLIRRSARRERRTTIADHGQAERRRRARSSSRGGHRSRPSRRGAVRASPRAVRGALPAPGRPACEAPPRASRGPRGRWGPVEGRVAPGQCAPAAAGPRGGSALRRRVDELDVEGLAADPLVDDHERVDAGGERRRDDPADEGRDAAEHRLPHEQLVLASGRDDGHDTEDRDRGR